MLYYYLSLMSIVCLDGPPPHTARAADMFAMGDFGDVQHTGGIPPWKKSPLVSQDPNGCSPYFPPRNPASARSKPPNYNTTCDPTGKCARPSLSVAGA